jgi:hypothetical protein
MAYDGTGPPYNYAEFTFAAHEAQNTWADTPAPGKRGADFPLYSREDLAETSLRAELKKSALTVVEFGSFT